MPIVRIDISECSAGIYLRWWFNGYHYYNFHNYYEIDLQTATMDSFVSDAFSRISKTTSPTKVKAGYSYQVTQEGISEGNADAFKSLLLSETVDQYEDGEWRGVDILRGDFNFKDADNLNYFLQFEVSRKDLPDTSTQNYSTPKLYIGDVLCDIDDDEVVPINKQVNDIAEMQDRQSDFTRQFRVKRTKPMRELFERSGEPGANPDFPYENQICKLVVDGVEIITNGDLIMNSTDDDYYYVSAYSGNLNFFKAIEGLTLNDLTLASTAHTWNIATQKTSQDTNLDYKYMLSVPNDDGGIVDNGTYINVYGGWMWPYVKVKAIWDEIFLNAGFTATGDIMTASNATYEKFMRLWMPIVNLEISEAETSAYLWSLLNTDFHDFPLNSQHLPGGETLNGDTNFSYLGEYTTKFSATYKIRVYVRAWYDSVGDEHPFPVPSLELWSDGIKADDFVLNTDLSDTVGADEAYYDQYYDIEYAADSAETLSCYINISIVHNFSISIIDITNPVAAYSTVFTSLLDYLPNMTQTEFIKMICNMFGLVPDTIARDKEVYFWNYLELYEDMSSARDWSNYLSHEVGATEFKYGNYAQKNSLKYKDSDDVVADTGIGNFLINDETLKSIADVIQLPISTADTVVILTDKNVARIAFNKYDNATSEYIAENKIDSRIVYRAHYAGKAIRFYDSFTGVTPDGSYATTLAVDLASNEEIAYTTLITHYLGLSRLLTKTTMQKLRFNLPVIEVSNLKHYIPIYLSQHNAYYYVNKVNNYISGKLCTVELIKL